MVCDDLGGEEGMCLSQGWKRARFEDRNPLQVGECNSRVRVMGKMFRCNKEAFENVFGLENKRAN
jgi:hypothetical protein